ncbi:MAG: preprotein translocase subunit SecG [Opitutales bacterium]
MEVFLTILTALLTLGLILVCAFMVIVILMQRASSNAGLGSALGGGAAESAFGGATSNVLIRATVTAAVIFFVLAYALHLLYLGTDTSRPELKDLPTGVTGVVDPKADEADTTEASSMTPTVNATQEPGDFAPEVSGAFEDALDSLDLPDLQDAAATEDTPAGASSEDVAETIEAAVETAPTTDLTESPALPAAE